MSESRAIWNPEMETLSRQRLRELQEARLLVRIPYAYQRSALLREVWEAAGVHPSQIRSLDDFSARVPVLRPDLRGFGRSSVPPPGYAWSVAGLARDLKTLLDRLEIASAHVVGRRVGGSVAMQFAHDYPAATRSLVVIGGPATLAKSARDPGAWLDQVRREGVEDWARATMGARLGDASPAMREWWIGEMGEGAAGRDGGDLPLRRTLDLTGPPPPHPVPDPRHHQRPRRARLRGNGARLAARHPGLQAAGPAQHRLSPRRRAPGRVRRGDWYRRRKAAR